MRILGFSNSLPGPNTRFIRDELEFLEAHHSLEYASVKPSTTTESFPIHTIPFQQNPITRKWNWELWKRDLKCAFQNASFQAKLEDILASYDPEIIHCHFAYEGLMLADNLRAKRPVIFHFHGYDASQMLSKQSYVKRLKHYAAQPHVHFIYCSSNIQEKLAAKGVVNPNSSVLRYGIDLDRFVVSPSAPEANPFVFLHISNLQEKKGLTYSISAYSNLVKQYPDRKLLFRIVGDGEERQALEQQVDELGLRDHVEFVGRCQREEVVEHLHRAHVFVHHSITASNGDQEGIPNAMIEAMAVGLPVLSSIHSGIPELIDDGTHGYLSEEGNVNDISEAMEKILDWKEFRLRACRARVEDRFNKTKHLAQLMSIYEEVLSKKQSEGQS